MNGDETHEPQDNSEQSATVIAVDRKLLELLVCPLTKTRLNYDSEAGELISQAARLAYPIRGGVPIMLVSEARELDID